MKWKIHLCFFVNKIQQVDSAVVYSVMDKQSPDRPRLTPCQSSGLLSCREKYCVEPELLDRPDLLCVVDRMQHVFHGWRLQAVSDWLVISLFSIYRVCLFLSSGFIVLNPNAQNNILLLEYTVCDLIFPSRVSSTLGHHAAPEALIHGYSREDMNLWWAS